MLSRGSTTDGPGVHDSNVNLQFAKNSQLWLFLLMLLLMTASVMGDVQMINFTQKLDHFSYYQETAQLIFGQMVFINDDHWSGAKAGGPIFVLFGGEFGGTYNPDEKGLLNLSAIKFNAMLLHIEHRFYGQSIPLGSIDLAMANHQVRGCLTTEQALEDYAEIINSLRANYSADASPVIVVGSGYSGALAAWFRLKYNYMAVGALASSAPMYYYGNRAPRDGFCSIVSKDFEDVDPKCYKLIRQSWKQFEEVASRPIVLKQLSQVFNTCQPLQSWDQFIHLFGQLYSNAAKAVDSSNFHIESLCRPIKRAKDFGIKGFVDALDINLFMTADYCFDAIILEDESPFEPSDMTIAWAWQRCTELVFPVGCSQETMLPAHPFDQAKFDKACELRFGTMSRPNTPLTFLGRRDILESLTANGGNIIFLNGTRDPVSSGGILDDISETIVAITTTLGSHSTDLNMLEEYKDPKWLKRQRESEMRIFKDWIDKFHHVPSESSQLILSCSIICSCLQILHFLYFYA